MPYIVKKNLVNKLKDISTTADILANFPYMCVCYGSQIIPYGNNRKDRKLTKKSSTPILLYIIH